MIMQSNNADLRKRPADEDWADNGHTNGHGQPDAPPPLQSPPPAAAAHAHAAHPHPAKKMRLDGLADVVLADLDLNAAIASSDRTSPSAPNAAPAASFADHHHHHAGPTSPHLLTPESAAPASSDRMDVDQAAPAVPPLAPSANGTARPNGPLSPSRARSPPRTAAGPAARSASPAPAPAFTAAAPSHPVSASPRRSPLRQSPVRSPNALPTSDRPFLPPAPIASLPPPPILSSSSAQQPPAQPNPLLRSLQGLDHPQQQQQSQPRAPAAPVAAAPAPTLATVSSPGGGIPAGVYTPYHPPGSVASLSSRGSTPDTASMAPSASTPGASSGALPSLAGSGGMAAPPRPAPSASTITPLQNKHLLTAFRNMKRTKDAGPFLAPVDPVKLNIPDYPHIIKHPMDLSTIERKLINREYTSVDAVTADVALMVDNCIRYNGEQSPFAAMALSVRKSYDRHLERLPPADATSTGPASSAGGAVGSKSASKTPRPAGSSTSSKAAAAAAAARRNSSLSGSSSSLDAPIKAEPVQRSKASSAAGGSAHRRVAEELKHCMAIVRDLFKKQYQEFSTPFLQPVDRKLYPQYFEIIKSPIDLSTIRRRLEDGYYASADDFRRDMDLMFQNCYTFNPAGTPVYIMGHRLESVFKQKWANRPIPASAAGPSSGSSSSMPALPPGGNAASGPNRKNGGASGASGPARSRAGGPKAKSNAAYDSDSSDDEVKEKITQTQIQIALLEKELKDLQEQHRERKRQKREARAAAASAAAASSHYSTGGPSGSASGPNARRPSATGGRPGPHGGPGGVPGHRGPGGQPARHGPPAPHHPHAHPHHHRGPAGPRPMAPPPAPAPAPEPEVTYEMKRELSEKINDLPNEKMQEVLDIIKESMPALEGSSEEIELDISALNNHTVYRLWQLVNEETNRQQRLLRQQQQLEQQQQQHVVPAPLQQPVPAPAPAPATASQYLQPQQSEVASKSTMPPPATAAAGSNGMSTAGSSAAASTSSLASAVAPHAHPHHRHPMSAGPKALTSVLRNSSDEEGSDDESSSSGSDSD
ncbi:transcription initiation at TATA-containing promoter protein [Blastocladiella emersonii ATCC 22665]|nr:transcription initiation at TATA-containing promoter protein [Blastocladiella emersonii ATCC 22665]